MRAGTDVPVCLCEQRWRARQKKVSIYHFSFVIFHRRRHEELKAGSLNDGFKFEVQLRIQSEGFGTSLINTWLQRGEPGCATNSETV